MRPLTRRVLIATAAVAVAAYYLLERLPVDRAEFFGFVATSVLLVGAMIVLAFLAAALIRWLRRLRR